MHCKRYTELDWTFYGLLQHKYKQLMDLVLKCEFLIHWLILICFCCLQQKKVIGELSLSREAFEEILSAKNKELEVTKVGLYIHGHISMLSASFDVASTKFH